MLEALAAVYRHDEQARAQGLTPEERLQWHRAHSGPVMAELHTWLTAELAEQHTEPNSGLGRAITYLLNHWEPLTLFLRQPGAPLDNYVCERALKKAGRALLNFSMDSASPLTLILADQTELRHRLALRAFDAIRQRIALRYHLSGLAPDETAAYLQHHLQIAGATRPIFSDEAVALIAHASAGLPRRLGNLATACLLAGWLEQKAIIDETTACKALMEWEEPAA